GGGRVALLEGAEDAGDLPHGSEDNPRGRAPQGRGWTARGRRRGGPHPGPGRGWSPGFSRPGARDRLKPGLQRRPDATAGAGARGDDGTGPGGRLGRTLKRKEGRRQVRPGGITPWHVPGAEGQPAVGFVVVADVLPEHGPSIHPALLTRVAGRRE